MKCVIADFTGLPQIAWLCVMPGYLLLVSKCVAIIVVSKCVDIIVTSS